MRVKSVHLRDYKRFTDLQILDIPQNAQLVVMIGPNGTGKSSVFDAFLFKAQYAPNIRHISLNESLQQYYYKTPQEHDGGDTSLPVWNSIDIQFHNGPPSQRDWPRVFNVRSPYRNEPELRVDSLTAVNPASEKPRFTRIIESDTAVSDDYKRLLWKRVTDLDSSAPADTTFGSYRTESIKELQSALSDLFPNLHLQDFGGISGKGGFRFAKGTVDDFLYTNLSGGEKGAFDLLLDIFVKREEFGDAIYCIDEPEAHIAIAIQGKLLDALLSLLPEDAQLWIATHSIGFVRAAYQRAIERDDVVFLDFSYDDFDQAVTLTPASTGRAFWRNIYEVALHDLAMLVGPTRIVLCEGRRDRPNQGFDAKCYAKIFAETHGDTVFLSRGGANQVEQSEVLQAIIMQILEGVEIVRLIDRDNMPEDLRVDRLVDDNGLRILHRRELENYLYDPDVLLTLFREYGYSDIPTSIQQLLPDNPNSADIKQISQQILNEVRRVLSSGFMGNSREQFELAHLATALRNTDSVYRELEADIFPNQ